jgi:hypothetical protein
LGAFFRCRCGNGETNAGGAAGNDYPFSFEVHENFLTK